MKEIVIADIRSNTVAGVVTGHFTYLAKLYQKIFSSECIVKVAGGPAYLQSFSEKELLLLPYNINGTTVKDKICSFQNCRKLFRESVGKTIILQQSSVVTAFIAIALFYRGKSKLLMIQYSNAGVSNWVKRLFYYFAKKNIDGVICPNDGVGKAYGLPYIVVPDYIYTDNSIKRIIPFEQKKYDFCMVGRLSPEKGILEAIRVLGSKNFKVLIAGMPGTEELEREICHACEGFSNIELHLGYVNEQDYFNYIRNSRYGLLNYQGEYSVRSSGVVYDMLFNGAPVIGKECLALDFVKDQGLGDVYVDITQYDFTKNFVADFYDICQQRIVDYCKRHHEFQEDLKKFVLE